MGLGYRYICKNCQKETEIFEGIGMLDFEQELTNINSEYNLLKRYTNGINKDELKKHLIDKDFILNEGYGRKIFQCPKCNDISNEFYFELESILKDGKNFISEYKCKKCKEKLNIIDSIEKCPYCGGKFDLEKTIFINLD